MKKNVFVAVILVVVMLLCACAPGNQFVGTWRVADEKDYSAPAKIMTLNDDGTAVFDGMNVSWSAKEGIFYWSWAFGSHEHEYEFKGANLYLDGHEFVKE